jgi:ankyrin repeat protein
MIDRGSLAFGLVALLLLLGACGSPPDTPLTAAIARGDVEEVRHLLEDHADPDERGYAGWTPLYVAVMHDQNEIAKLLLAAGASVNRRSVAWLYDADGRLPLELAATRRNTELVRLLLERGAEVDARDFQARPTALMSAARFASPEIVELLIAHGADVNARDRAGATPLEYAASGRAFMNVWTRENARLLIGHGADVNGPIDSRGSPVRASALAGDVPVLVLLIEHGADVRLDSGVSALALAARNGHLQATQVLAPFFRGDRAAMQEAIAMASEAKQDSTASYLLQLTAPHSPAND